MQHRKGQSPMRRVTRMITAGALAVATLAFVALAAPRPALAQDLAYRARLQAPSTDDLDGILKRGELRALVPFSQTYYYLDAGEEQGLTHERLVELEKAFRKAYGLRPHSFRIVVIPTPWGRLIDDLEAGRGDIAMGNIAVTPERQQRVDFSTALRRDISEIVVTHRDTAPLDSADALSGQTVHVPKASSYLESVRALDQRLKDAGKPGVTIVEVDDRLSDEALLKMVANGLVPAIIIDRHVAEAWTRVFPTLRLNTGAVLRSNGENAIAVRKSNPELRAALDRFVPEIRVGSNLGNDFVNRHLRNRAWLFNPNSVRARNRFARYRALFEKHGTAQGFDWVLIAAQSFRESRFNEALVSRAGAVGLMQVLPSTGRLPPMRITNPRPPEPNVIAGTMYLRVLANRYFPDLAHDPLEQTFFTLAAYNAGPSRFARFCREASARGLDPNKWFDNVEWVVMRRVGAEPVVYVADIFKYYIAFKGLLEAERGERSITSSASTEE